VDQADVVVLLVEGAPLVAVPVAELLVVVDLLDSVVQTLSLEVLGILPACQGMCHRPYRRTVPGVVGLAVAENPNAAPMLSVGRQLSDGRCTIAKTFIVVRHVLDVAGSVKPRPGRVRRLSSRHRPLTSASSELMIR
jgi:hypothetical protein